ncbi:MAG: GxxExxY protein [Planctomycetota bacterium]
MDGVVDGGRSEPDAALDALAQRVIGACIEVHRHLGPGYLEATYSRALSIELELLGIAHEREAPVRLAYKGRDVGDGRLDFLVGGRLVVELKAVESLSEVHRAQVIAYLKATGHQLGLLVNFNEVRLADGLRRIIHTA